MSGNDQVAEGSKPRSKDPAESAEDKLFNDSVQSLTQSIKNNDVTQGLRALDEKIYSLDLGPQAADALINNVFSELKKNGELPNLVSKFYAQNKERLTLDDKSYLDIESLDKRLPGGGVYDLNRAERHAAAFIADNVKKISEAEYNITFSDGQLSDGDFKQYAKQQSDEFNRYNMARKIQKHFGSQEAFDALDAAGAVKANGSIDQFDLAAASKMNNWLTSFSSDAQTKQAAKERQEVLDYLSDKFHTIPGTSYGLSREELALFIASEKDPRSSQVLNEKNRLFDGNPGPEAYQKAVAEGYTGSQQKFTSDFIDARVKEGMTPQEAMRELNRSTELSGFRADVVKQYLNANKEALGASRTDEITKKALEQLKERKTAEGKLREVEILETAINRFDTIANKVSESSLFTDKAIKPNDLDAYADAEKSERAKAKVATQMHNRAYHNIHELSGESQEKKPYEIKVPWSKIESMKKFYENAEKNPGTFTEKERAHHKEMKEVCEYMAKNLKTSPQRGSSSGHEFNLTKSYNFQKNLNKHNQDRFDAPKQVEKPKVETPKEVKTVVPVDQVEVKTDNQAPSLIRADSNGGVGTSDTSSTEDQGKFLGKLDLKDMPKDGRRSPDDVPLMTICTDPPINVFRRPDGTEYEVRRPSEGSRLDSNRTQRLLQELSKEVTVQPEEKLQERPPIAPYLGPLTGVPEILKPINPENPFDPLNSFDRTNPFQFSGDGDTSTERPSVVPVLPRAERPATPDEFEQESAQQEKVTEVEKVAEIVKTAEAGAVVAAEKSAQVEKTAQADRLSETEFAKVKEAFQYDAMHYGNALRQAARENKPLVLIAGTKNSSAEFLKSAAAQANSDKAVYVFVDLESANPELSLTRYLESNIAMRNSQTNRHDDNWTSVFKVSNDGQGGVVNHSPEYSNTGVNASNLDSIQKALTDVNNKAASIDRARAYSNQGTVYTYPQARQSNNNYYNSNANCRPRRGVFGFRR